MLSLLRRISLPELRRHPWRYLITAGAILLGVAMFLAVRIASLSLAAALRDTVERIAGEAVLEVTAGTAGVPEVALQAARSVPGVHASPVVSAVVRTAGADPDTLLLLGLDLTSDLRLRRADRRRSLVASDPLALVRRPDSLVVAASFAARHGLREGDPLAIATPLGPRRFVIRGLLDDRGGLARAFGGNVAVLHLPAAQQALSRGSRFDRIDVALEAGTRVDEARAGLAQALGPGYRIEPPLRRGRQTEGLMDAFSLILALSSLTALLVGVFLIFNAFSVSVAERRRQIAILRALGATRRTVRRLFLAESLLVGLASSLVAVPFGIGLGRVVMLGIAAVVEQTYGLAVQVGDLAIDPLSVLVAVALGLAASAAGGLLPARAAAHVEPALALQRGTFQALFLRESWSRRWSGALCLALALVLGGDRRPLWLQGLALVVLFAGLTLLVPTFSHLLARLLRRPLSRLFGIEGQLASDSLVQAPRRTSATVAALVFSLAFVVSSASFSASVKTALLTWVESAINPDVMVSASPSFTARTFQLPAAMAEELRRLPGVRQVDALRIVALDATARSPLLVSIEIDQYLARSQPVLEEGRQEGLLRAMLEGGVLVSNNLARLRGLHVGDPLPLATPAGRRVFRVAGVQADYTSENGSLLIDRRLYSRLWKDDQVDTYELMLAPGAEADAVKAEVYRRFAGRRNLFVLTNRDFRAEMLRLANQFWLLTYAQLVVAIAVGVLGIVNSLNVSIAERRREIAVLRALGGERRRVRRMFVLEAAAVGLVALALGTLVGATLGRYVIAAVGGAVTGWVFPYRFPLAVVAGVAPGFLLACALAAWAPAARAARLPVASALEAG